MSRTLAGVKVLAFEQAVAMPFCSFILAEMGAEVIKVERPGRGDVVRGWDRVVRGLSSGFVAFNANKRDLTVNARAPEGREILRALARRSDVFLENFAPGVVERLGLGPEELRGRNPRLIYCSLSGYGRTGPYRDVKAYDLLIQGEAGVLTSTGYPDAPAKVGLPIADLVGGLDAVLAVLLALYDREHTGQGEFLDCSLFEGLVSFLAYYPHYYWHAGTEPPRTGMRHQFICPYGPYAAADHRYVNLVVANEDDWQRFCLQVVDRPGWIDDPRFRCLEDRRNHRAELERLVEEAIAQEPTSYWMERLARAGLPYGEVRGIAEVLAHPQVVARRLVVTAESPVGEIPLLRYPLSSPEVSRRIPGLGEHTEEILGELGYTSEEIVRLRRGGVI